MKNKSILFATQSAMIAALYVVLMVVFAPSSSAPVQVRIAEALTILPYFSSSAIPGLFLGCLVGNVLVGNPLTDIIFGSLATLIGAVLTHLLRKRSKFFAPLPPILSNAIIIPFVLRFTGVNLPIPYLMLTIGVGQIISCGFLGMILTALEKYRYKIFKI